MRGGVHIALSVHVAAAPSAPPAAAFRRRIAEMPDHRSRLDRTDKLFRLSDLKSIAKTDAVGTIGESRTCCTNVGAVVYASY